MIRIEVRHALARIVRGKLSPVVITVRKEVVDYIDNSCMILFAGCTPKFNNILQSRGN